MFTRPDNTYNDIREKSLMQWLDEMEQHRPSALLPASSSGWMKWSSIPMWQCAAE